MSAISTLSASPRRRVMASVAAIALVAGGAFGAGALSSSQPAQAEQVKTSDIVVAGAPDFSQLVQRVKPAVVSIRVKMDASPEQVADGDGEAPNLNELPPQMREFFRRFGGPGMQGPQGQQRGQMNPRGRRPQAMAQGSGFFVSADGFVVTNNHVVRNASEVTVVRDDGTELAAKVIGTDPKTDLALLKVSEKGDYPFVVLAKEQPLVGQWVVAIGNPFGLGGSVTAGIVSARGRDIGSGPYDDFLQIDAPINKGNSGGPTFNLKGEVVGVNTAIYSPSGGNVGLAFAIPASTVSAVTAQLENGGKVERAYLGVQIQPVTKDLAEGLGLKEASGALVANAEAGTPAAKAGIKSGDVIVGLDGSPVKDARDLTRRVGALKPGAKAEVAYLRDGEAKTATITLAAQEPERQARAGATQEDGKPVLGARLAPAKEVQGAGDKGVAIVSVDPDGQAAAKGLSEGDVILEVAGKPVENAREVQAGLQSARKDGKKAVLLRVKTAQGSRFVAIDFSAG